MSARRYRYTGKERDEETGLYYNGARYLAAWLGRWTSADPIGIGADGPGLYNYTRGSPVNYTDPSGTDSLTDWANRSKPSAKGTTLADRWYVEPHAIRQNFDTADREFQDPNASVGAKVGLLVAGIALTPATFLEETVRAVENVPHSALKAGGSWYEAFTAQDPDDALAYGLEGTKAAVTGVLAPLEMFVPRIGIGSPAKSPSPAAVVDDVPVASAVDPPAGTGATLSAEANTARVVAEVESKPASLSAAAAHGSKEKLAKYDDGLIDADIGDDGMVELLIWSDKGGSSGRQLFERVMNHFGNEVKGIRADFVLDNLKTINELTAQGMSIDRAINHTFTAKMAWEHGFTNVRLLEDTVVGSPGNYTAARAEFY